MHQLHIPRMKCGGCLSAVTRAIHSVDPQATVEADLETRQARVASHTDATTLLSALKAAGYPAEPRNDR
jgi:copper chaperone